MPTEGRPKLTVRLDPDERARFVAAAEAAGIDGAKAIRAFIAWFVRERGAKLPGRPPRS